jgi:hypothetical protein
MTWRGDGNVGIGTTSPDTLLHLSSTTDTSILRLERNSVTITSGQSYGQVQWEGQDASSGAAGVRGSIDVVSNGTLGETNMVFRTSGSNFNSNLEHLCITSAGNVGIGTTSPTSKLHVVGLPSYADNAAAITGGLTVGAFYHTSGTLKVVI